MKAIAQPTFRNKHAPYRIYRRKTARRRNGRTVYIYYVALWDYRTQRYGTGRSSGQTNRVAAERWAALNIELEAPSTLTIEEFAYGMFDEGNPYLIYREQRCRGLSWSHRRHCRSYLQLYILPHLGRIQLAGLTTLDIERFQDWLVDQPGPNGTLSPSTANHVTQAPRLVTKWAIRQNVLHHDPFLGVENLATNPRRRGIFTIPEVEQNLC